MQSNETAIIVLEMYSVNLGMALSDWIWEPWVSYGSKSGPLCRRPARTLSKVEGEAPRKNAFVLSLRALRSASACGSKE